MNTLDKQYTDLLQDILDNGVTKQDRTGTGTLSAFGRQIRHKMSEGFPLLTTKKMPFRLIATELMWFLRGDTNIKYLVDNNCHIWDGDAFKNYLNTYKGNFEMDKEEFIEAIKTNPEFAQKWGELGPVYGKQWRSWTQFDYYDGCISGNLSIDQIKNLTNDLKTNPDSRRLMVNAWNVGELDQMTLPPCHYGFQVYTRELSNNERIELAFKSIESTDGNSAALLWELSCQGKKETEIMETLNNSPRNIPSRAISLMWNQRSVDTFLGLPFNIASYGLLLEIIAKAVNMVPDELIGNLGDTHLYLNHIEQAKEQIGRELSESERYRIFEDRGYEFRMVKDWSKEEQYDKAGIPTRTREPYPLPTLKHLKTDEFYKALSEDASLFTHLEPTDFQVENYQAHPHIKAPLSN
jgi:thymidylate synthase